MAAYAHTPSRLPRMHVFSALFLPVDGGQNYASLRSLSTGVPRRTPTTELSWNIKEADRRDETPEKEFTDVRPHSKYNNIALFYA